MSFAEFLVGLQGPFISSAVGALLSVVAEYVPQYQGLSSKWKRVIFAGGCFGVPIVAAAAACGMGYQPCSFEQTFWPAIYAGGAAAFSSGTLVHTAFMR